ncbi:unnamed protein product [Mytilus edulis]|uniref:Reverse transcriptase domain-containing protein n=1 Tax=Mytilus edulis TaxID=6550 RepID=A0A8S3U031_MYTED|nr:unnamed protein product [Mytilus edulis]
MLVSDVNLPIYECKNSLTARKNPEVVTNLLQQEVDKGFLKGPFSQPPFLSYRVSPLGIATHKYSKKQRLIIDLSSPHNLDEHYSVNDLIDKDLCSLTYIKIDDAINAIQRYGSKSLCCKVDISDAFKQLPIKKEQWHLFCVKWNGQYYHYVRLPFGCRSSPRLFDSLSTSVCWIAQNNYDIKVIFHLLDDFLTVDKPSDCGERTMALLSLIFNKLNIPLSSKKTVGPVCELEYLGIILDTINMQARLPLDKVERITQFISFVLDKKSCTRRELEQLLGHLNFATRVILPGRAFVTYLYRLMCSVKESHHYVHLNKECKSDLTMWLQFLSTWNGINMFYESHLTSAADMHLFTDASSTIGFGGFYQGKWFCDTWPTDLPTISDKTLSIAFLELYPIVVSAVLWGKGWYKKRILFHCDNLASVIILTKDEQISSVSTRGRESSNSLSNPGRDYLDIAVENLQTFAVADSTKALYNVGYEHYLKFLQLQGSTWSTFQLPPVSENLLMRFIAYCESNKHLRYSTIKSYLCGIRFYYLLKGGVNPLENFVGKPLPKLKSVLVGLKKKHAIMPKRIRLPITFDILYKMCFLLRNCIFDSYTDVLIEAACVTAFFGFLRCGEFSVNDTKKFDHESNLCLSDVQITNDCIFVHLKKSKTDPFRYGITIPLFKNNTDICPVVVLQKYYRLRMSIFSNSESFFITNKGDPLSRNFFISHVKCTLDKLGLSSEKYNGHSFRSGAATTAHKARLEDHLIQTLGRWSSDCYTKYIHTSPDVLRQAQIQMTSTLNN